MAELVPRPGSPLAWRVFELAFRPWMRRRIADVKVTGLPREAPPGPLLLCANHTSFWDGFLLREVHRRLKPEGRLVTIMLERELRGRPLLRAIGGLGVVPGSLPSLRRVGRTLEATVRRDPALAVSFFPQGRIWPVDRRPLAFLDGLRFVRDRLVRGADPGVPWILPVALRLESLVGPTPTAFVSVGAPVPPDVSGHEVVGLVEARVTGELDALGAFLRHHGEASAERWPGPDGVLPRAPGQGVTELTLSGLLPAPALAVPSLN